MGVYTLQNSDIKISVNSKGAELTSIINKNGNELLWQAEKDIWPRHAPVLFPIVGRLKNNQYQSGENEFTLSQHGFARDVEFEMIEQSENAISFELTASEESLKIFPFHFSLIITYQIKKNRIKTVYKVFNPDSKDLYFSIGAHPGFKTNILPGENMSDYSIKIEGKQMLTAEILKDGLLTGETREIHLNEGILKLDSHTFDNDALVFKNSQIEKITLFSSKSGNRIEMNCKGWPYFGIWSKKDCDKFICLEPWCGITDSINSTGNLNEKEGILIVNPYQFSEIEYILLLG